MEPLLVTRDHHVATVTFNRPDRHNAITFEMFGALPACSPSSTTTRTYA